MRVFWKTDTSLHGGRRGGVRENSRLASVERASPETFLADNCLVPACGPCSVDLSDNPDLGASLFQVLGVTGVAAWPHGGHLDLTADGAIKWKAHRRTRR